MERESERVENGHRYVCIVNMHCLWWTHHNHHTLRTKLLNHSRECMRKARKFTSSNGMRFNRKISARYRKQQQQQQTTSSVDFITSVSISLEDIHLDIKVRIHYIHNNNRANALLRFEIVIKLVGELNAQREEKVK